MQRFNSTESKCFSPYILDAMHKRENNFIQAGKLALSNRTTNDWTYRNPFTSQGLFIKLPLRVYH